MDARYPDIIDACALSMRAVMPANRVNVWHRRDENCVEVSSFSKARACLFPQHGPGLKHHRRIRLVGWQTDIVEGHSRELLRGLIHSDGSRFTNVIKHGEKTYAYPRYMLSNESVDIQRVFCDACDRLGIVWTKPFWKTISVARNDSVAVLDDFVGPKS